jgi:hypothetical protein
MQNDHINEIFQEIQLFSPTKHDNTFIMYTTTGNESRIITNKYRQYLLHT